MNPLPSIVSLVRSALTRPGHSFLVVSLLTVGIAGNSAIFGLVHSLLYEPLAFPGAERLVSLDETAPKWNLESTSVCFADFDAWRRGATGDAAKSFEAMALIDSRQYNLSDGAGGVQRVDGAGVTHELDQVLGTRPALGRLFDATDDVPDGPQVVVIGHRLWQQQFAGRDDVLGRSLQLNGVAYEVIGVLPAEAHFPPEADLWLPLQLDPEDEAGSYRFEGVGRLRSAVDPAAPKAHMARLESELNALLAPLHEAYPWKSAATARLRPLRDVYTESSQPVAKALAAVVVLVLGVACANIAGLLLAAGVGRAREVSIRMALGAPRRRVVARLVAETGLLATIGAVLGTALGVFALGRLGRLAADQVPFWVDFRPAPEALVAAAGACVGVALAVSLAVALRTTRVDPQVALRSDGHRTIGGGAGGRVFSGLVIAEMALAQVLIVGAALVFLSEHRLQQVDPGYRTEGVLSFHVALPAAGYPTAPDRRAFYERLEGKLAALPGVDAAAWIDLPPLQGHSGGFAEVDLGNGSAADPTAEEQSREVVLFRWASPDYFATAGVDLVAGRPFRVPAPRAAPEPDGPQFEDAEVVINQTFAKLFFGDLDPIGKRLKSNSNQWLTVSGVARDVHHYGPDQAIRPGVYLPGGAPIWFQVPQQAAFVLTSQGGGDVHRHLADARAAVRALDPTLPLYRIATFEEVLSESMALRRLTSWLFGLFAAIAVGLAAFGTYAVLSFVVGQRRRELGVRLALGARPGQILGQVWTRGVGLACAGVVLGLAAAIASGRFLGSLLYGIEPDEPAVLAVVALGLLLVATAANAVPALRAARLDPMKVLREE